MGDRNLFLGPHVITAQSQRGIGIIGTIENRGPPPMPPMAPMLYRPRETTKTRCPGLPDRALAMDQATHERETNTAILRTLPV